MWTNDQISVYLFSRNEPVGSLPQQSARTSPIPGNVMFRAFCVASLCVDDPEWWWAICGPSVGHRVQIWDPRLVGFHRFATDPVLELVRALCFLVYCALKDEKKVVYVENLSLAPVGCMQKSRYVWTHHLKS